jgi:hypothetical protein
MKTDIDQSDAAAMRRLGLVLYALAFALGIAELGVMRRASEWLSYEEIGTLGGVYTIALACGFAMAPALRVRSAVLIGASGLVSAVPIIGMGLVLVGVAPRGGFVPAAVLWALSGFGAGVQDTGWAAQSSTFSTRERVDGVAMLAVRFGGILFVSLVTAVAVATGVSVGWEYVGLGVVLLVPLLGVHYIPEPRATAVSENMTVARFWALPAMGAYMAAAVLPTSVGFAWIPPIMAELHGSSGLASIVTSAFVGVETVACVVYFNRSRTPAARLVLEGGIVATVGVILLVLAALHGHRALVSAGWGQAFAAIGFALLGWGVSPLPGVVQRVASQLTSKWGLVARMAMMVVLQCILVGLCNLLFGQLAELWTAATAYAITAVLCVACLFIGRPLLRAGRATELTSN